MEKPINYYRAGDYAGLEFGKYKFYFGYEETICPKHGREYGACEEAECARGEWAFVVRKDEKELMCIPESKLKKLTDEEIDEPEQGLVVGIGYYLSQTLK